MLEGCYFHFSSMHAPNISADPWKPRVITVHGVGLFGFCGAWQQQVADTLGEHFRFDPIRHSYYRFLAGTELVLEPLIVLLLIPIWHAVYKGRLHFLWALTASVLVLFVAYLGRRLRHALA